MINETTQISKYSREYFSALVATPFLILIFIVSSGVFTRVGVSSYIWLVIYLISAIFIVRDRRVFILAIKHSWFLLLLPCLAIFSTLWSLDPQRTLIASFQMLYTVFIGLWIGVHFKPEQYFKALLIAMAIGVLLSIINGYFLEFMPPAFATGDFVGAERYLIGIYDQKNVLGKAILLLSLALLITGLRHKYGIITFVLAALLVVPMLDTKSASSLVNHLIILSLPLIWLILKTRKTGLTVALFILSVILFILLLMVGLDVDLVDKVLASLGKDSSLTGRTVLWNLAIESFIQSPILGIGYEAYWQPGVYDATQLLRSPDGEIITGFHNAFLEVIVATGIIGLALFIIVLAMTFWRSFNWWLESRKAEAIGCIYFIIVTVLIGTFDTIVFWQHEIFNLMVVSLCVLTYRYKLK